MRGERDMYMRNQTFSVSCVVAMVLLVGVLNTSAQTATTTPKQEETLEQRLERLEAQGSSAVRKLLEEQAAVRERAEEIQEEETLKEARKALRKADTKVMKQARREIEKAEKRDRNTNRARAQVVAAAAITGCVDPANSPKIVVSSRAVRRDSAYNHVVTRIENDYPFPVDIEDNKGHLVKNLCPGGTITLLRQPTFSEMGAQSFTFQYIVRGVFPDGSIGKDTRPYTIQQQYPGSLKQIQNDFWIVRLQKVN